jgi:hypothetical protein
MAGKREVFHSTAPRLPGLAPPSMVTAMRRIAVILGLIFLATLFQGGGAVAQDSGPTDADLKAAYCLSVIQISWRRECTAVLSDPSVEELRKKRCHDDQTNVERLKDYLVARGYLVGKKDPTPTILAGNRGSADFKDCVYSTQPVNPEEVACLVKCYAQPDVEHFNACHKACPTSDSCRRIQTCDDLSFLPF